MTTTPLWTIDQACSRLGLTRHQVVALIVDGTLSWTLSADRGSVLIHAPADVPPADAGPAMADTGAVGVPEPPVRPSPPARHEHERQARQDRSPALTDVDAWSQPK